MVAERREHFVRAQAEVWNSGMASAPGMLGGVFAAAGDGGFLVLSGWRSAVDHERYPRDSFPGLRLRSGAADDLERISGDAIELEPPWSVLA